MLSIITYIKRINFWIIFGRGASKTSICILLLLEVLDSWCYLCITNSCYFWKEPAWHGFQLVSTNMFLTAPTSGQVPGTKKFSKSHRRPTLSASVGESDASATDAAERRKEAKLKYEDICERNFLELWKTLFTGTSDPHKQN